MQVLCYLPSKSHILLESQGSHTEQPQHRVSFSPFHWPGLSQKVSLKRAQHPESLVLASSHLIRTLGLVNFLHARDYRPSPSQHSTVQPLPKHPTPHSAW